MYDTRVDKQALIRKINEKNKKYIQSVLTRRDLLELLAEESSELTKASLKLIRAEDLSKNVTPISPEQAMNDLFEEVNDVLIVLDALGWADNGTLAHPKWQRWANRLREVYGDVRNTDTDA